MGNLQVLWGMLATLGLYVGNLQCLMRTACGLCWQPTAYGLVLTGPPLGLYVGNLQQPTWRSCWAA